MIQARCYIRNLIDSIMSELIFYRYVFDPVKSNTYLTIINKKALIIDPTVSNDLIKVLEENSVDEITIFLTHEHYDHSNGINWLRARFLCFLICQENCADMISKKRNNRPIIVASILKSSGIKRPEKVINDLPQNYECSTDCSFKDVYFFIWNGYQFEFVSTPGHSSGSCCILYNDEMVFTGDSLIMDEPVITRFPGGSKDDYINETLPFLKELNPKILVMPGHGEKFSLGEYDLDNINFR